MTTTGRSTGVNVYQIIETVAQSLGLPELVPVIIGPCYQIRDYTDGTAGAYAAAETTYSYPDLISGAIPDPESVVVYGRYRDKPLEVIAAASFSADASGITVVASLVDALSRPFTAMYIGYKAFRTDLSDEVVEVQHVDEIESLLGVISLDNPLAYAASKCALGTSYSFYAIGIDADSEVGYQKAANNLETEECYFMVPLSSDAAVIQIFNDHVNQMSDPLERKERIVLSTVDLILNETYIEEGVAGSIADTTSTFIDAAQDFFLSDVSAGMTVTIDPNLRGTGTAGSVTISTDVFTDLDADFTTDGVSIGDFVQIPLGLNAGYRQVLAVTSATVLQLDTVFSATEASIGYSISELGPNGGAKTIASVTSATTLVMSAAFTTTATAISYTIIDDYSDSKYEQATALKSYAAAIADKRVMVIFPDVVVVSVSGSDVDVPSYYFAAYLAGKASFEKADKPFANLAMGGGFVGLKHSNKYFNESQLRTIAEGGIYLVQQDSVQAPVYARRQYMTDTSDLKTQEFSIVKAVDWGAKYYRANLKHLVGIYNISDRFLQRLGIIVEGINDFVSDDVHGVFRYASVRELVQDPIELDHVALRLNIGIKYPMSEIDVYMYL